MCRWAHSVRLKREDSVIVAVKGQIYISVNSVRVFLWADVRLFAKRSVWKQSYYTDGLNVWIWIIVTVNVKVSSRAI